MILHRHSSENIIFIQLHIYWLLGKITEEGDIHIQEDTEVINKGASVSQTLSPDEKKKQEARLEKMKQLTKKIKSLKSIMNKAMNRLEKDLIAFEKLEDEQALTAKVKKKAIEVSETLEKLEKKKKDLKNTSDDLREVYYECRKEELKEADWKSGQSYNQKWK